MQTKHKQNVKERQKNMKRNIQKYAAEHEKKETHLVWTDKQEEEKNTCGKAKGEGKRAKTKKLNKHCKTRDKMQNSSWENYNRQTSFTTNIAQ